MLQTGTFRYKVSILGRPFRLAIVFMIAFVGLGILNANAGPLPHPTYFKFGGETLHLPYAYDTANCQSVRSQLFLRQNSHTSPAGKVQISECNEDIQWKLPQVSQSSLYELVVEVFSFDRWHSADTVLVGVHPRNLMDPLRAWAENNTLMVADSVGKLEAVLKFFKIPYKNAFGFEPPSPQAIMKVGHREYIFNERGTPLPIIQIEENRVVFDMPVLDKFSNNPLLQSKLIEIMEEDFTVPFHSDSNALDMLDNSPSGS